jgi:hypothetical protein
MRKRCALLAWSLFPAACLLVVLAGTESRIADAIPAEPLYQSPVTGGSGAPAQLLTQEQSVGDVFCLTCHADSSLETGFADGRTLSLYVDARVLRDSAHQLLDCVTCHDQYEIPRPERRDPLDFVDYQNEAEAMCARCHEAAAEGYDGSAHWQSGFKEGEVATCAECHSPDGSGHSIAATSESGSMLAPARLASTCGRCHEQARNTYEETSHGKVARFGNAAATATCTSCHEDHAVEAVDELLLPTLRARLAAGCAECHDGAGESFFQAWPGHSVGATHGSAASMVGRAGFFMAAAVFAMGLTHASLDFWRRLSGRHGRLK